MHTPPPPIDETARLMSLHSLRILDTPPEERFDRITRMAKRLFNVDICLISLVDSQRQWFKSKQGLEASETPREISFCGHAILKDAPFIVTDASLDPRFSDNPLVIGEPKIRFYAGQPIQGPNGHRIGTFCLIDSQPRDFSTEDRATLKDLAAMVEDELCVAAQVTVDDLTQIANRRGFNIVAGHLLSLCQRTNTSAQLAFFDLDGFKQINDEHGHGAGDQVLQHFAKLLIKSFRSADVIARLGGDEFAVLMAAAEDADSVALTRLKELAAEVDCGIKQQLAWSVGLIRFDPERHDCIETMLADADQMMYAEKQTRRNAGS